MRTLEGWLKQSPATQPGRALSPSELESVRSYRQAIARLLIRQEKHEEALKRLAAFMVADPLDAELHNLRSSALAEMGQADAALAALEKAQKMNPEEPSFNNNLGYMLADRGLDLDRSERMIRTALAEEPAQIAYKDSLGWVFYKQGKFREAARVLEDVIRQSAEDEEEHPVLYDHAGDACWRLGEKDRAVKLWQRAIELLAKEETLTAELRQVKARTPQKLQAVKANREPPVAPLGRKDKPAAATRPSAGQADSATGTSTL